MSKVKHIKNLDELFEASSKNFNGKYKLSSDIEVRSSIFDHLDIIGELDGNNHTIRLIMDSEKICKPLFNKILGSISNLRICVNAIQFNNIQKYIYGFAEENKGTISNCSLFVNSICSTELIQPITIAGFVVNNYGKIANCYLGAEKLLCYRGSVFGFVYENYGEIYNCSIRSRIYALNECAGLFHLNKGKIESCTMDVYISQVKVDIPPNALESDYTPYSFSLIGTSNSGTLRNCKVKANGDIQGNIYIPFIFNDKCRSVVSNITLDIISETILKSAIFIDSVHINEDCTFTYPETVKNILKENLEEVLTKKYYINKKINSLRNVIRELSSKNYKKSKLENECNEENVINNSSSKNNKKEYKPKCKKLEQKDSNNSKIYIHNNNKNKKISNLSKELLNAMITMMNYNAINMKKKHNKNLKTKQ